MHETVRKKLEIRRDLRKSSTPQEKIFWSRVRAKRFRGLKFRRQHSMGGYAVDFICLEKKIIIELDGYQYKEENHKEYDEERSEFLRSAGFEILRFWNNEINENLEGAGGEGVGLP